MERHYYKSKTNNNHLNLKTPLPEDKLSNYIEITKEQFDEETYVSPYVPTAEELHKFQISSQITELKSQLSATDYQAIKYAEGLISEEDYAPIKAQRQSLRDQINALEAQLD